MKPIDADDTSMNKWEQDIDEMMLDPKNPPIMSVDEWRQTYDEREKQIAEIKEKIRKQMLAHIDFANPDEVTVDCRTLSLYSIQYYGIHLDMIAVCWNEEMSEYNRPYEILLSYEGIKRVRQMAMLLDEARNKWGI